MSEVVARCGGAYRRTTHTVPTRDGRAPASKVGSRGFDSHRDRTARARRPRVQTQPSRGRFDSLRSGEGRAAREALAQRQSDPVPGTQPPGRVG